MLPWEFRKDCVLCLSRLILNCIPLKPLLLHCHFLVWANIAHKEDASVPHVTFHLSIYLFFLFILFTLIRFEPLQFFNFEQPFHVSFQHPAAPASQQCLRGISKCQPFIQASQNSHQSSHTSEHAAVYILTLLTAE